MKSDVLLYNGLSFEVFEELSFESKLGKSLKKNIHYFDKEEVLKEIIEMTEWLWDKDILGEISIDYRIIPECDHSFTNHLDTIKNCVTEYLQNRYAKKVVNL